MEYKTYNIELNMSQRTRSHWLGLLAQTRDAFNRCAQLVMSSDVKVSLVPVHNLCYDTLRSEFPSIPAQGIIRVQKSVVAAIRAIRANGHKNAKLPRKKSLSLQLDKRLYSNMTPEGISLSNGEPLKREKCTFVLYDQVRELFATCPFTDPTIFFRDGRFFLSVPFEVPTPPVSGDTALGVDLGMRRLFVTSDGEYYKDTRYLERRRKVRYLKRRLKNRGTRSAKRHLGKLSRRERNLSKDMLQRATAALVSRDASIYVLEDLKKIKTKTSRTKEGFRRKRHNSALSQVPLAEFREVLTHKAQLAGKRVETVSPTWTSQTDSRTGRRDGIRRGCRYYCKDGVVLDADWNAAVNIALRAKHPLSGSELPLSGRVRSITRTPRHQVSSGKPTSL